MLSFCDFKLAFGSALLTARKRRGLSRRLLARISHVDESTIRNYEEECCGASLYNAVCVCRVLGLSLDKIFDLEERP